MKRIISLSVLGLLAIVLVWNGGRYVWGVATTDYYYGTVTQPPKVGKDGDREIGLLAPGETIADTINLSDFCMMPGTSYCRFNTADLHNTFSDGKDYCVRAYGWRLGLLSMKPNLVDIVLPDDSNYDGCVAAGAPSDTANVNTNEGEAK